MVTFKDEKRRKPFSDTAGGGRLKEKESKGEYKYIGDQMKTVDEKRVGVSEYK